jgi:hypothetical protein
MHNSTHSIWTTKPHVGPLAPYQMTSMFHLLHWKTERLLAYIIRYDHYKALQAFEEAVRVRKRALGRDYPLVVVMACGDETKKRAWSES